MTSQSILPESSMTKKMFGLLAVPRNRGTLPRVNKAACDGTATNAPIAMLAKNDQVRKPKQGLMTVREKRLNI